MLLLLMVLVSALFGGFVLGLTVRHVPGPPGFGLGVAGGAATLGVLSIALGGSFAPGEFSAILSAAMDHPREFVTAFVVEAGLEAGLAVAIGAIAGGFGGFFFSDWLEELDNRRQRQVAD